MSEAAGKSVDFETLLEDALRPIEPPESLSTRLEATLATITEHAAAELSNWAAELSEGELQALRDPRNWLRPVGAIAAGSAAAAGLAVVVGMRRRQRPTGLRAGARRLRIR
jgi:hypothetical protein